MKFNVSAHFAFRRLPVRYDLTRHITRYQMKLLVCHSPSELRFEMSETSFATESVLRLGGMREPFPPSPRKLSDGVPPVWRCDSLVAGEWDADGDLCLRIVEKRLTNDVLCLNLEKRVRAGIRAFSELFLIPNSMFAEGKVSPFDPISTSTWTAPSPLCAPGLASWVKQWLLRAPTPLISKMIIAVLGKGKG